MCSFAEHGASRALLACVAVLAVALGGCFDSRRCGDVEVCNYRDDDCDGRYDEDFRDENGRYAVDGENCGGCGLDCRLVFPTADRVECVDSTSPNGTPTCVLVSCAPGFHRSDAGGCAPDLVTLCRPCRRDLDCAGSGPGAACLERDEDTGLGRCFAPCEAGACAEGLRCDASTATPLCVPEEAGFCDCSAAAVGATFGCLVTSPLGLVCEGRQECAAGGLLDCASVAVEDCDGADDDCDGIADEDFRDDAERYVALMHCGGCNRPCAPPGPNMTAECVVDESLAERARCDVTCFDGFVDVDGIGANGCECQRWDGSGPPPSAGGDGDCDGIPDDATDFVYVTSTGNDLDPGSLARPKRTIQGAIAEAARVGKDVLVARGIYQGPVTLEAGVSVYGGYRPDFRDRSLTLYPVVLESNAPGLPALVCRGIVSSTRVDGLTLEGRDAQGAGVGSTAAYFDGCGAEVVLADVTVFAAHGSPGTRGATSAENLLASSGLTLSALDGVGATAGTADSPAVACRALAGGVGGRKTCFGASVAGGDGGGAGCPAITCSNGSPCANAGCTDFTTNGVCDFATVLALAVPNGAGGDGAGVAAGEGGEATYNSPTNRGTCNFCDDNPTLPRDGVPGVDGTDGADGAPGVGCALAVAFDAATGRLRGGDGTDGGDGRDGSGGGGGSGGSGYEVIGGTDGFCSDRPGGSGGGGGSGGCGAPAASGGVGGGASVGLVVRATSAGTGPTFVRTRVVPVSGGDGGDGGVGAAGGTPGGGAPGGRPTFWCARSGGRGGDGGAGGAGGGGGGGCGGGSHGLVIVSGGVGVDAYRNSLDSAGALRVEDTGRGGRAGVGGESSGGSGTDGLVGSAAPVLVVP